MKNYVIAVIAFSLLNGCGKKGEDQVLGRWSFSSKVTSLKIADNDSIVDCNIEFRKDSTFRQDCLIHVSDADSKGTISIARSGDWFFKKQEKTDGYFLMKPKASEMKFISMVVEGQKFSHSELEEIFKDDPMLKERATSDSEVRFTVLSEKNGKLFIEISSSTEEEFSVGSFSMEKYDEKNDKVKLVPNAKISKTKASEPVTPDTSNTVPARAEEPIASTPHSLDQESEIKQLDGNWYSYKWKYGYTLKEGKGFATITNSPNFEIGQEIVRLKPIGSGNFAGENVYKDGKFYKVKVTLQFDGRLLFEGEKNVQWTMERISPEILFELKNKKEN